MKVAPIAIVRALITRLTPEERLALAGELTTGAAAALRPVASLCGQPVPVMETFDDACPARRARAV